MIATPLITECLWQDDGASEALIAILSFLDEIGIPVLTGDAEGSVLPGMTARRGTIVVDAGQRAWAGDLLHEAGHIALTDPAQRPIVETVSEDPGEEMGAIAWSWAAVVHLGLDAEVLFHAGGYRGASASLAANYKGGGTMGVPMLALYSMTAEPHRAAERGIPPYPVMQRWLR